MPSRTIRWNIPIRRKCNKQQNNFQRNHRQKKICTRLIKQKERFSARTLSIEWDMNIFEHMNNMFGRMFCVCAFRLGSSPAQTSRPGNRWVLWAPAMATEYDNIYWKLHVIEWLQALIHSTHFVRPCTNVQSSPRASTPPVSPSSSSSSSIRHPTRIIFNVRRADAILSSREDSLGGYMRVAPHKYARYRSCCIYILVYMRAHIIKDFAQRIRMPRAWQNVKPPF